MMPARIITGQHGVGEKPDGLFFCDDPYINTIAWRGKTFPNFQEHRYVITICPANRELCQGPGGSIADDPAPAEGGRCEVAAVRW